MTKKEQISKEVYTYLLDNYKKIVDKSIFDDKNSYLEYNIYSLYVKIIYNIYNKNRISSIDLHVNNEEIITYEDELFFNKNFKFYKKIYNYFLQEKKDSKFNNILDIINTNKPVKTKRTEKVKNILN